MKIFRNNFLDYLRGITIISMVLYHVLWSAVHLFGLELDWYIGTLGYVWQQTICWAFILIAGFSWSLGKSHFNQGLKILAAGVLIAIVSSFLGEVSKIVFGILIFLGSATIILIPLNKLLAKIPAELGLALNFLLFLLFRNINRGTLGFENLELVKLPKSLYDNGYLLKYLGFDDVNIISVDYFSLIPWLFLFITGYYGYQLWDKTGRKDYCAENKTLKLISTNSLLIYLVHQPIIYVILKMIYK